ncbi:membrane protein [Pseudonocardia kongjuensis]|uniref:Membrane protein n=1 Tax=Pseudonocardia kongjuensis TaxID=102227 RepID=A0ABN1XY01_9PSEU
MSWLSAVPLVLLAAAWVTLPGLAVGVAAGLRGIAAWGAAPLLSVGLIAGSAVAASLLGVPWSGMVPVATAALFALVVVGTRRLVARRPLLPTPARVRERTASAWETLRTGGPDRRWTGLAAFGGMLIAWVLGFRAAIRGMDRPDALSQTFDSNFHYNAVARILNTADASSLTVGGLVNSPGFYPSAWHDVVSLVVPLTPGPGEIVVASNVVALVTTLLIWPLSVLLLVRTLVGRSAGAALAAPVLSLGFIAFPWTLVTYGALWPNLLGVALIPAALATVAIAARPGLGPAPASPARRGPYPPGRVARWFPVAAAVPALGFAHPNALFGLVVVAVPPVLWGLAGAVRRSLRSGLRANLRTLATVPVVAAVGAGLAWFMFVSPILDGIRGYYWEPQVGFLGAVRNALLHSPDGNDPAWSIALLTVAGSIVALRRSRTAWLVPSHVLVCTLYIIGASTWSSVWTGVWYNDAPRIAALVPVTAAPLAALGLVALCSLARRVACVARDALTRAAPSVQAWPRPRAAVLVAVGVLAVVVTSGGLYQRSHIDQLAGIYQTPEQVLVGPEQAQFLRYAGELLPADAVVAQNPWAGTAMLWPLTDRQVLFPHLTGVWSEDQLLIADRLREASTDPAVCAAVAETGVGYVITAPPTFWEPDPLASNWPGLDDLHEADGFELLAEDGDNALWRITACDAGRVVGS